MSLKQLLGLAPRSRAPLGRAGIKPGLYHYMREANGVITRFHLRVDSTHRVYRDRALGSHECHVVTLEGAKQDAPTETYLDEVNRFCLGADGCMPRDVQTQRTRRRVRRSAEEGIIHVVLRFSRNPVPVLVQGPARLVFDARGNREVVVAGGGLRVELDGSAAKMGHKIREATLAKVPYMLVIGQREADSGRVSVRHRTAGDLGSLDVDEFLERIQEEVRRKSGPETHISVS